VGDEWLGGMGFVGVRRAGDGENEGERGGRKENGGGRAKKVARGRGKRR